MLTNKDITIIIRSAGERTVPVILNLLKQQAAEDQIFKVNEVPNSRALKAAYKIGINEGREWILLIDGDVLPFRNMVNGFVRIINGLDERVFCIQCDLVDKMFKSFRPAGVHMYRVSLLEKALSLIPEENQVMRPESTTMRRMAANGFPTLFINEVFGLHDFEQYYTDLYRKGFFCSHKFTPKIPYLKKLWGRLALDDKDYDVLLEALKKGEQYNGLVVSNVNNFSEAEIADILHKKGISEKEGLSENDIDYDWIHRVYQEFNIPVEYYNFEHIAKIGQDKVVLQRRFLQLKGKLGVLKMGPWIIGNYLEKTGKFIKRMLE